MATKQNADDNSNRIKDPDDWVTGDEDMTGAQESYLHTLAQQAHEKVEPDLTKAEASKKIDELKEKTGRGRRPARRAES
ncbi:MAG: DUF3072 domain-containing protein [Alphaproteobacteria bacterium]|nr:DUF3072 domain-containing protein [Alphaproteobacteria bacterium]